MTSIDERVLLLTNTIEVGDLIGDWLEYHRAMGFAGVIAMDFGSADSTPAELASPRWAGFVHVVPPMPITADANDELLDLARERGGARWALMCDTDEFLVTPTGNVSDLVRAAQRAGADAAVVPRYHMETVRSAAAGEGTALRPPDLRLRWVEQDQGKVLIDLLSTARADLPGHNGRDGSVAHLVDVTGMDVCLLHYPVRSYRQFAVKVDCAEMTLRAYGDTLDEGFAWHWRRWIAIRDEQGLEREYLEQFLDDAELDESLAAGTYAWDSRLVEQWRQLGLA